MSASNKPTLSSALVWLAGLALVALAAFACTREDYEPDPKPQTLVPCDPSAAEDDPLACPPDAAVDAGIDAAPLDAPADADIDAAALDGTAVGPSSRPNEVAPRA
ncbi:MAG: hypothetical protein HOV81_13300 [Kofleriaceae bacterium]|nr:hypothetical protein [Kofleriaceae bacterium]